MKQMYVYIRLKAVKPQFYNDLLLSFRILVNIISYQLEVIASMKTLTSLIVSFFLVWHSSTISSLVPGIAVVGPITQSAFQCLKNYLQGSILDPYAIIRIHKVLQTPGVDPYAGKTITNAIHAGYRVMTYMQICRGQNAESQINGTLLSNEIFLHTKDKEPIFLKVQPNSTPGCSWEDYSYSDNCQFLNQALTSINLLNGLSGVFSTPHIWGKFFGNSCDQISSITDSLWYTSYNTYGQVDSLNLDFSDFGGWRQADIKQTSVNVTLALCSNPLWNARVDQLLAAW